MECDAQISKIANDAGLPHFHVCEAFWGTG